MAGSARLVREPDVYELRAYVGRDPFGRLKHRYERFIGNKRAAQRALAALVAEVDQGKQDEVEPGNMAFGGALLGLGPSPPVARFFLTSRLRREVSCGGTPGASATGPHVPAGLPQR